MAVTITWSSTNGGTQITAPLDHGGQDAGNTLPTQTVYVRHDGVNDITNCKLYLGPRYNGYTGAQDADTDFQETLDIGSQTDSDYFGGFQINQDATNSFAAAWPTLGSKGTTSDLSVAFRNDVGDSVENGIPLHLNTGVTTTGTIPTGGTPNIRFQLRIVLPIYYQNDTLGERQFSLNMRYTYTS
jgi:hypothetical protein